MTNDNRRYITLTFVAFAILLAFTSNLVFELLAAHLSLFARMEGNTALSNGLPVAIGIIVFAALQFNKACVEYTDQVISELRKVVWPTQKETGLMTVVVVITLIFTGVLIGVYDWIWTYLINAIIR